MNKAWLLGSLAALGVAGSTTVMAAGKPTIAVVEFTNQTSSAAWWGGDIGMQLADVLSNELSATGDFTMVERQKINAALAEQDFTRSGRVRAGTGPNTGNVTGAKYLVTGQVSAYTEGTSSTGGGINIAGFHVGGGKTQAYVAIDLRVVDAETSEVVFSRTVEGRSSGGNVDVGGDLGWGVGGDFQHSKNTPASKAVRAALAEASNYLDCAMVKRNGCMDRYNAKEQRRKQSDEKALDLDGG